MRVAMLTNLFPPQVLGGYELLARDVERGLTALGHRVDVWTTGPRHPSDPDHVHRVLRLARPFGTPPARDRLRHCLAAAANDRALARGLQQHGLPDVALVMSLRRLGLAPVRMLQQRGVPVVFTVNDDWPLSFAPPTTARAPGVRGWLGRALDDAPWAAHTWRAVRPGPTVYLSDTLRRAVRAAELPLPEGIVRAQGVNLEAFSPRLFRPLPDAPALLFVGRLHPDKGPDAAIDAVATMRARGCAATLDLLGDPVTPEYLRELQSRVAALHLTDAVRFRGGVSRESLPDRYRAADALVFVSRLATEGQGLTHLEAMACGVPVVAWPSGGARELLVGSGAAAIAERDTGDALADALLSLRDDPERQRAQHDAGLAMVRERASLVGYIATLAALLREAIPASTATAFATPRS